MSKLKDLRQKNHLTQAFMGDLIGVSESTYCKKENGSLEFSILEAHTISKYFNQTIENIFEPGKSSKTEPIHENHIAQEA